jgi:spore maturation protein CgeB
MQLLYLNAHTFLVREIANALAKRADLRPAVVTISEKVAAESVHGVFEQLNPHLPAVILSVNNAGYDFGGELAALLLDAGCHLVNWFTDDPFYEETFYAARAMPHARRIDLVSEESFVPLMRERGLNAHFLPLATDPAFFNTDGPSTYARDVAFVGNSTLEFLDGLVDEQVQHDLEKCGSLVQRLREMYFADPQTDLRAYLLEHPELWRASTSLPPEKFVFVVEWFVGYLHRRDVVTKIAARYKERFTCFGDPYWQKFIDPAQVSADACYYTNLCAYYRSTRVNLNVNRIQIRTSFTQRIFDCKAGGAFILTDARALNSRFFVTRGPERELVEFSSPQECMELIDYYLAHEQEREAIASRGRGKVLREHTYDRRLEQIVALCGETWGI